MYNNLFRYNIGRSVHNPLGDTTKVSVRHSNVMTSRVVLVLYIYLALGIYWLIEQPLSSVFEHLPRFKWLCTITKIYKLTFRMDRFGSDTPKGTVLYSPRPFVRDILDYPAPREVPVEEKQVVIKTERPDGTVSVSGGRDLKKTQVYTRGFGEAVPILYIMIIIYIQNSGQSSRSWRACPNLKCSHAKLPSNPLPTHPLYPHPPTSHPCMHP